MNITAALSRGAKTPFTLETITLAPLRTTSTAAASAWLP